MIAETGHFALWLAAALAVLQLLLPLKPGDDPRGIVAAAVGQALLCTLSFAALVWLFVTSDFSVELVVRNSHVDKPMLYKITGAWANHEGSMLLWVTVLSIFGAVAAWKRSPLGPLFRQRLIQTFGALSLGFYAYLLISSNPFIRLPEPTAEGMGLNPLLQDPGLAFHPPLLYLGYVGFSAAFAYAVAALLTRQVGPVWARHVRPWVLTAWAFLSAGITLGSFWAYYELGWGGWWFWDPVENASLMPWLAGTALLHSVTVLASRNALRNWTILLAVAAFSLSMVGTFIVRSGLLTSVHAFAVDPERGLFLLILLGIYVGGALILYATRAGTVTHGEGFRLVSREGGIVANNLIVSAVLGVVFIGTLYPVGYEAIKGARVSVGPPYFEAALMPLFLILLPLMAAGPFLRWRESRPRLLLRRLIPAVIAGAVLLGAAAFAGVGGVIAVVGVGLAALLGTASLMILFGEGARRLSAATLGTAAAHFGAALMALGISISAAGSHERILTLAPGQAATHAGFSVRLDDVEPVAGPNYTAVRGDLTVTQGSDTWHLFPERRAFIRPMQVTTETDILPLWRGNLYAVLGDSLDGGRWQVRLHWQPMIALIWCGGILAGIGGLIATFAGRPRRRRERREATTRPETVAA